LRRARPAKCRARLERWRGRRSWERVFARLDGAGKYLKNAACPAVPEKNLASGGGAGSVRASSLKAVA